MPRKPRSIDKEKPETTSFFTTFLPTYLDYLMVEKVALVRYFRALRSSGIAARSVARALAAIRGLFRFLVSEKYLKSDPTENVENPRLWSTLPKVLPQF